MHFINQTLTCIGVGTNIVIITDHIIYIFLLLFNHNLTFFLLINYCLINSKKWMLPRVFFKRDTIMPVIQRSHFSFWMLFLSLSSKRWEWVLKVCSKAFNVVQVLKSVRFTLCAHIKSQRQLTSELSKSIVHIIGKNMLTLILLHFCLRVHVCVTQIIDLHRSQFIHYLS